MFRKTYAQVNLEHIKHNVACIKRGIGKKSELYAVVKADAYGHGAVPVSHAALAAGAKALAVALPEEALPLREAGIGCPILVLGRANKDQLALSCKLRLDQCVFSVEDIEELDRLAATRGGKMSVHVKVDTGMGRIGLRTQEEMQRVLSTIAQSKNIEFKGIFTHFACSDSADKTHTNAQIRQFDTFVDMARRAGFSPLIHAENSAGAIELPLHFHAVRLGISMYGCYPSDEVAQTIILKPAMQVFAEISNVKTVEAGQTIGYGASYTTREEQKIATVQIGYGDGYNRLLSNVGRMIVPTSRGAEYAPIVGRVCMDQTMIDVTGIDDVHAGDVVVVMGNVLDKEISADEIAALCGTISYEILLDFSWRVPRIYI